MTTLYQSVAYLRHSAWRRLARSDKACPACAALDTRFIKRKHLVTELRECQSCYLRFRWPKDSADEAHHFYQKDYSQGFTTDCPSDERLATLLATDFRSTEKDYSPYLRVLEALGLSAGSSILDFGCSWGYGSWQLSKKGFCVYSHEISAPRARYAAEKLQCNMIGSIEDLPRKVDCFFSAHVIEHLPNPNLLWEAALSALKPDGMIVVACPNGNPERENTIGFEYHRLWGKIHPLYITPKYALEAARRKRLRSLLYSTPYDFSEIAAGQETASLAGDELLIVAFGAR
ncbi:MAG TPA: class I SAM-dependent methyltransferase [Candidatus Aquilonibacter sp.]|nr:class I SAM-dependent methyltransferase [Candidatus Aquilonibacter sp.]